MRFLCKRCEGCSCKTLIIVTGEGLILSCISSYYSLALSFIIVIMTWQVKVDAKTKALLDEHKKKKKEQERKDKGKIKPADGGDKKEKAAGEGEEEREEGETKDDEDKDSDEEGEVEDEFTLREDRVAKAGLDAVMREYATDLAKEPAPSAVPATAAAAAAAPVVENSE
jgi:hypothetical protein